MLQESAAPRRVPAPMPAMTGENTDTRRRPQDRDGFLWIDSARNSPEGLSFIGTDPSRIVEGGPGDWALLEDILPEAPAFASGSCDARERKVIPPGGVAGFIRFDGSFRFGVYGRFSPPGEMLSGELPVAPSGSAEGFSFRPDLDRGAYEAMVRRTQEYIAAGDIYQACIAHRFRAPAAGDPWKLYLALRTCSPAPHAAYINLGGEQVLSSSPECFLEIDGRTIRTRPIKGTRPRGTGLEEDDREARDLVSSPKEAAELVMITDLERNDLGSVCEFGSVRATELLKLERHAQVHHLVSTVEGRLRPGLSHLDALAACFPGGSISGAPKKRALEIIRELEPAPRGLFTGAIGYFGNDGRSQFNIAIRTVVVGEGEASFHVGAGITAGSDPGREWEETLHKAAGILKASGGETFRASA